MNESIKEQNLTIEELSKVSEILCLLSSWFNELEKGGKNEFFTESGE